MTFMRGITNEPASILPESTGEPLSVRQVNQPIDLLNRLTEPGRALANPFLKTLL